MTVLTGIAVELGMSAIRAYQEEAGQSATVGGGDEAQFGRGARGLLISPALTVLTVVGPGELRQTGAARQETPLPQRFPERFQRGSQRVES
jgi:hypothetical protein